MMALKYFGQLPMTIKAFIVGMLLLGSGAISLASPAEPLGEELALALSGAEGAWVDTLIEHLRDTKQPYDEKIFTELSPILDSLEPIKLPEDQTLSE